MNFYKAVVFVLKAAAPGFLSSLRQGDNRLNGAFASERTPGLSLLSIDLSIPLEYCLVRQIEGL